MPISEKVLIEILAMLLSIGGIWLTTRRILWCWFVSIIASALYGYIFWRERLYADAFLQLFFITFAIYGWYCWYSGKKSDTSIEICHAGISLNTSVFCIVSGAGLAAGWVLFRFTNATIPFIDALLTSFSLGATWLQAKKFLESWVWWFVIDVLYVGVFISRDLWITAFLYAIFCALALWGYRDWKHALNSQD